MDMSNNEILVSYSFRKLRQEDIPLIVAAFTEIGWNKPASLYQRYFQEQENNQRCIWIAFKGKEFLGYVTLKWHSDYPNFNKYGIPEINDLNVLPSFRNKGIGSKLLDLAEAEAHASTSSARAGCGMVGLGVGLYADYGNAQKLYIKRGYIPDGHGATYQYLPVVPGEKYPVDDDLILWFLKKLV